MAPDAHQIVADVLKKHLSGEVSHERRRALRDDLMKALTAPRAALADEYRCEHPDDSEDAERIAEHFGLDAAALRAAASRQTSFSALGLAPVIVAYLEALWSPDG
jgi:hypothetical protein